MSSLAASSPASEFTAEERAWMLSVARQSIAAGLRRERLSVEALNPHLAEYRGAFTTLHIRGHLRGCVGFILPQYPLYLTIVETARAAAFHDTRFSPLSAEEFPLLTLEISVLSPMAPIRPEEVEVGRHGLLVTEGARRGVLLPQVPLEFNWDRETFLSQTCVKAGLPPNAWKRGATFEAFTAEIFGE